MWRRRKWDAILRLLRGEDLEAVSRSLSVTAAALSGWRDAFLAAKTLESGQLKDWLGEMLQRCCKDAAKMLQRCCKDAAKMLQRC